MQPPGELVRHLARLTPPAPRPGRQRHPRADRVCKANGPRHWAGGLQRCSTRARRRGGGGQAAGSGLSRAQRGRGSLAGQHFVTSSEMRSTFEIRLLVWHLGRWRNEPSLSQRCPLPAPRLAAPRHGVSLAVSSQSVRSRLGIWKLNFEKSLFRTVCMAAIVARHCASRTPSPPRSPVPSSSETAQCAPRLCRGRAPGARWPVLSVCLRTRGETETKTSLGRSTAFVAL